MILCLAIPANAQQQHNSYDAVLAKKLHADERGMRMYVMAILKTGDKSVTDPQVPDSLFKGHMANINRMAEAGLLSVAGPFEKNDKNYRGIFILNVTTIKEAEQLVATDPTIKAGIFAVELYEWYGSAALQETGRIHKRIDKSGLPAKTSK